MRVGNDVVRLSDTEFTHPRNSLIRQLVLGFGQLRRKFFYRGY